MLGLSKKFVKWQFSLTREAETLPVVYAFVKFAMKVSRLQINDEIFYLSASYDLLFEGNWIDNVL